MLLSAENITTKSLWGENCPYMGIDSLFGILELIVIKLYYSKLYISPLIDIYICKCYNTFA